MEDIVAKRIVGYENYSKIRMEKGIKNDCRVSIVSGVPRSTFCNWKKGRSSPGVDNLTKIAKALKVNVSKLIV